MKNIKSKVGVCSRSFSRSPELRQKLLHRYANVKFNESGETLSQDSLVEFLKDCDKAIIALEKIDKRILNDLPKLKVISKYGVGLDMLDLDAINQRGILLGWKGGLNARSVSELVISNVINLLRHISSSNKNVINGGWKQFVGSQLSGKTFGIIGCGHVGKDLIKLLQPFNCKVLVNDIRSDNVNFYEEYNVTELDIEELLAISDIISIHTPLDNSTKNILNKSRLNLIKKNSVLINAARGGLVDEVALFEFLRDKKFYAAFDVLHDEPPVNFNLLNLDNFIVTPHIGGSAIEAINAMGESAIIGLDHNSLIQDHSF